MRPLTSLCFAASYESTYISPVLHCPGTVVSMRTAAHQELQVLPQVCGGAGCEFYVQVSNLEGAGVTCGCEGLEEANRLT